jgi:hypothetical protein
MAVEATKLWEAKELRRRREQIGLISRANPGAVEQDRRKPDDAPHFFDRNHVLFALSDVEAGRIDEVFSTRDSQFVGAGRVVSNPIDGLVLYELPERRAGGRSAKGALRLLERVFDDKLVFPDHLLHVSPIDNGRPCPATEPAETGLNGAWPARTRNKNAGKGVTVAVVDTGRHRPCELNVRTRPWLANDVYGEEEPIDGDLREYAGHGSFIAGVVRCRAPKAVIRHERFNIQRGGAVRESALIAQLNDALDYKPEVINLSAGTHTRDQDPLKSFDLLWENRLKKMPNTVLVAAAGNDSSDKEFFPAALPWCVGVGSLDRDGRISTFSNYGQWVDVFAIGRNHVNAYPQGRYVCNEPPDKGDARYFDSGLARWSGTSFAAPLVAGIVAALAAERGRKTVTKVKDEFLSDVTKVKPGTDAERGNFNYVVRPYS